ncbi:MAG: hypothetical protein J0L92_05660 [Deltaproteobacteria bacterium]|nr:hypothetical protein [Deltaproteobacteria bacterium]
MTRAFFFALAIVTAIDVSGCCCCFGGDWSQFAPPTTDDAGAEAEARRHYVAQAQALLAQLAEDAGGASGCTSGVADFAARVTVAVISRGHAGSDSAAQVQIDPAACFTRVVVLVVLTEGVWHAVSMVADAIDGRTVALGTDPGYLLQIDVGGGDSDFGSDEMF